MNRKKNETIEIYAGPLQLYKRIANGIRGHTHIHMHVLIIINVAVWWLLLVLLLQFRLMNVFIAVDVAT